MPNVAPRFGAALKRAEPTALRDPHIREPLHHWLRAQHSNCADTEILHELKIPRPSARIDIAVVNGELCGFEIKSDVDSLTRLPRQARAFNAVFDRVCVVTTPKHLEAARTSIPPWWGLIVASGPSDRAPSFVAAQAAQTNPRLDIQALLHMLCRRELVEVLAAKELDVGLRTKRRPVLINAILARISPIDIKVEAMRVFKLRAHSAHSSSSSPYLRTLSGA